MLKVKFKLLVFLLLCTVSATNAQNHYRKNTTCFESGHVEIVNAADSGFYLIGHRYNPSYSYRADVIISRFNANEQRLWTRTLQNNTYGETNPVVIRTRHNKLVGAASTNAVSSGGTFIFCLDTSGSILWKTTISTNGFKKITEASNGDLYFVFTSGVVRYDSLGNFKWGKNINTVNTEWSDIMEISPQRFLLIGTDQNFTFNNQCMALHCIDSAGVVIWARSYGIPDRFTYGLYSFTKFVLGRDGYLYVSGNSHREIGAINTYDVFLMKLDTVGYHPVWTNTFGTNSGYEQPTGLKQLRDGTFIVWGITDTFNVGGNYDGFITRFDSLGHLIGSKRTGQPATGESFQSVLEQPNGTLILPGIRNSNAVLSKISPLGSEGCTDTIFFTWPFVKNLYVYETIPAAISVTPATITTSATPYIPTPLTTAVTNACYQTCTTIAEAHADRYRLCINDTAHLINTSINALRYRWYLNNTLEDTTASFDFAAAIPGIYQLRLVAIGSLCSDSILLNIQVDSLPSSQYSAVWLSFIYNFSATYSNAQTEYTWNFGDGNIETGTPITYDFTHPAVYPVTLTASNSCGISTTSHIWHVADTVHLSFDHHIDNHAHNGPCYGKCALQLPNGNILFAGAFNNVYSDAYLGLTSRTGAPIWERIYNLSTTSDEIDQLYLRWDNTLLLLGSSGTNLVLAQMDTAFQFYSQKKYSFTSGFSGLRMTETRDKGFTVCGKASMYGQVAFFNPGLSLIRTRQYPGTSTITNVFQLQDASLVMVGNAFLNSDCIFIRTDSTGAALSKKNFDSGNTEAFTNAVLLQDGSLLVCGTSNNGSGPFPFLLDMDVNGNILWSNQYTFNTTGATPTEIIQIFSGDIFVWCSSGLDGFLMRLDAAGNLIYTYQQNGVTNAHMTYSNDEGLLICGYSASAFTTYIDDEDVRLIQLNPSSFTLCNGTSIPTTTTSITWNSASSFPAFGDITPTVTSVNFAATALPIRDSISCYHSSLSVAAIAAVSPAPYCTGSAIQFTDQSYGPVTYRNWTFPNGTPSSSTAASPTVIWNTPGTYTVTLTAGNINSSSTTTLTITVGAQPVVNAGPDFTTCLGTPVTLTTVATGGNLFSWLPSAGLSSASIQSPAATPGTTTMYTVSCSNAQGCIDHDTVTVNILPLPTVNAGNDVILCAGDSATLAASGNGTPSWSPSTGLSSAVILTPAAFPTTTTIYTLHITNSYGCSANDQVLVTVNPLPAVSSGPDLSLCAGDTVLLSATGNGTPFWNPPAGLSSTVTLTPNAFPTLTTTYTLQMTNSYGCSANDQVIVTVNPLPQVSAGPDLSLCAGDTVVINAVGSGTVNWSPGTSLSSASTINPLAWPSSAVTYTLQITSAQGCPAMDSVTITVYPSPVQPIITVNGNILYSSPAASYQWYFNGQPIPGATADSLIVSGGGAYAVAITDLNGCTSALSAPFVMTGESTAATSFFLQAYPNPASQNLDVMYTSSVVQVTRLGLYDIAGREVWNMHDLPGLSDGKIKLSVSALANGTYLLVAQTTSGNYTQRIIVSH